MHLEIAQTLPFWNGDSWAVEMFSQTDEFLWLEKEAFMIGKGQKTWLEFSGTQTRRL